MDKNLYGVSAQVIAPGVLVFSHIFAELMQGYADPVDTPSETFARMPPRESDAAQPKTRCGRNGHTG
ncbi:hypothetical protein C0J29_00440 [Mycobacterium paragordonae]|uniref:Uncharacterized protein n=1 Tax=Mycobacterium paragordonae TaxID=1389713 RepID=A0ABQ1CD87_9MYCO|nr:hypothetical protein C0J29_00440 [Mycobacterium paragordonae]GFG82379.1 hypothetical protein MPRG_56550 [Mycobacterium paragordonae]